MGGINTHYTSSYFPGDDHKEHVTYDYIQDNLEVRNVMLNAAYGVTLHSHDDDDNVNTKQNEAYAMSITTRENEAYRPVVSVSGECDEYDYI